VERRLSWLTVQCNGPEGLKSHVKIAAGIKRLVNSVWTISEGGLYLGQSAGRCCTDKGLMDLDSIHFHHLT